MTTEVATVDMSSVAVREYFRSGNVAQMNDKEKDFVLAKLCERYGLDPILRPFDLISFQGSQKFYMTASATNQLANAKGLSREVMGIDIDEARLVARCTVKVSSPDGRAETANGFISVARFLAPTKENPTPKKIVLEGEELANALLKLETKTKRRATLSFFGVLDAAADYEERPQTIVAPNVPRATVISEANHLAATLEVKAEPAKTVESEAAPEATPQPSPEVPAKKRGRPPKDPQPALTLTDNPAPTIPTLPQAPVAAPAPAPAPAAEAPRHVTYIRTQHASYLLAAATAVYGDGWAADPAKKDAVKRAISQLDGKVPVCLEGAKEPCAEFIAALRKCVA